MKGQGFRRIIAGLAMLAGSLGLGRSRPPPMPLGPETIRFTYRPGASKNRDPGPAPRVSRYDPPHRPGSIPQAEFDARVRRKMDERAPRAAHAVRKELRLP